MKTKSKYHHSVTTIWQRDLFTKIQCILFGLRSKCDLNSSIDISRLNIQKSKFCEPYYLLLLWFKMNFALFFAAICLVRLGECKYKSNYERRDTANEIRKNRYYDGPPDHTEIIPMARYVLHNADWASIATISVLPAIEGFPFSNVKSIVDGSMANSTGVPYFYMSPLDFTAKDLAKNTRSTLMVSLEETRYCEQQNLDPEDPRCTRLMLSGKMKKVKEDTPEYTFAKAALFERHPAMANFPADHDWFVAKMKIAQIAMIDWFGGAKYIPVRDYLAYNYTGTEMLDHHTKIVSRTIMMETSHK